MSSSATFLKFSASCRHHNHGENSVMVPRTAAQGHLQLWYCRESVSDFVPGAGGVILALAMVAINAQGWGALVVNVGSEVCQWTEGVD